jgi:hypothetical protein
MEENRTPLNDLGTFSISSALVFVIGSSGKMVVSNVGFGRIDDGKLPVSVGESRLEDEFMARNDPT